MLQLRLVTNLHIKTGCHKSFERKGSKHWQRNQKHPVFSLLGVPQEHKVHHHNIHVEDSSQTHAISVCRFILCDVLWALLSSFCGPWSRGVPDFSGSFNPFNSLSAALCELGLKFVCESLHLFALVAQWSFSDDDWTRPSLEEFFSSPFGCILSVWAALPLVPNSISLGLPLRV